jgi:toxin ParE1/3/4
MAEATFAPAAAADLDVIATYIAADNPRAAARTIARIKGKAQALAEAPGIGRPRDELLPGIRSFAVGRYVIFYRPTSPGIEVIRVLHGMRDIDAIFAEDDA